MVKTIKQFTIILFAAAMALSFGCGIEGLIDDLRNELKDDIGGSVDFAPDSIDGVTLHGTFTSGTGDFASSAGWTLSIDSGIFVLVEVADGTTTGPYTYTKTGPNTATWVLTFAADAFNTDGTVTILTTFTSATTGTYISTGSGGITGTQSGSFFTTN